MIASRVGLQGRAQKLALTLALLAAVVGPAGTAAAASPATKTLAQSNNAVWALVIEQKQAAAQASMRQAGVGPSLAGSSTPTGR